MKLGLIVVALVSGCGDAWDYCSLDREVDNLALDVGEDCGSADALDDAQFAKVRACVADAFARDASFTARLTNGEEYALVKKGNSVFVVQSEYATDGWSMHQYADCRLDAGCTPDSESYNTFCFWCDTPVDRDECGT